MLLSLALIFLIGMLLGEVFRKLKLPGLIGMLLAGFLLGPYGLNLLDPKILSVSLELRQTALIIILLRAGLNLDGGDLMQVGRPAVLMCFLPACFEIIGVLVLAPILLKVTLLEAAIMGTVVAAVSPAVVVPSMLKLMKKGYGTDKGVPQMIMAGASVDDVFVIVLFTAFTGLMQSGALSLKHFLLIPESIVFGLIGGLLAGLVLSRIYAGRHIAETSAVVIILSVAFLLVAVEQTVQGIGFSGLLAAMALGATLRWRQYKLSRQLSRQLEKIWIGAQVLLFVLVGASVNIHYALNAGTAVFILIMGALLFRAVGVFVSLYKTDLNEKERLFTVFAYLPKATVQAAIGGLPLAMGFDSGEIVLTVAVLAIIFTAPLGAALIDSSYKRLLGQGRNPDSFPPSDQ